jgi:hypothetical protein
METHCSSCGKVLAGSDVLYTPTGDPICQVCNDKGDIAKGLGVSRSNVDDPAAMGRLAEARGEYEFDVNENLVIKSLAMPMRFVAIMSLIFGGIQAALGLRAFIVTSRGLALLPVLEGALVMLVGSWLLSGARALSDVVETQGADVTNLMTALKKLRNVYMLQAVFWALLCVILVFGIMMSGM